MKKIGFILFGILVVASAGVWWTSSDHSPQEGTEPAKEENSSSGFVAMADEKAELHGITTKQSGPGTLMVALSSRGKIVLDPDRLAHILPKVAGVAVEARKNRGDAVAKGEVLAVLESREMAEIKANYLASLEKRKTSRFIL